MIILSYRQAEMFLQARKSGEARVVITPDLGLTTIEVQVESEGIRFPDGQVLN